MASFATLLILGVIVACLICMMWRVIVAFVIVLCFALIFVGIITIASRAETLHNRAATVWAGVPTGPHALIRR